METNLSGRGTGKWQVGEERPAQRLSLEWPSVTAAAAFWPTLPLWARTEARGLTRPAWAATRSSSGATAISTLSATIALLHRGGDRGGGGGPQPRRRLAAGVGEHPGLADEAGRDQRDADPARGEVGAQAEREAAQAELGRVVDGGAGAGRLARQRGDEDEVAGAALEHFREEGAGEQHRRLEVDAQGALHLLGGELGQPARAGQPGVGDEDVDARGRRGEALGLTVLGEVGDDDPVVLAGQATRPAPAGPPRAGR